MLGLNLPDVPDADWPLIFFALDGALLVLLALWWLAKVTLSAPHANQTGDTVKDDKKRSTTEDL